MGGWDSYCFLCYAGFYDTPDPIPYDENTRDEFYNYEHESEGPDFKALFPLEEVENRLSWLPKFRTIGVNRRATGIKQCYITGRATAGDYGAATIEDRGDHPNALSLDLTEMVGEVSCYTNMNEEADGDLPIHDSCLIVLCRAFEHARGLSNHWNLADSNTALPFDLDSLFACLAPTRKLFQSYLDLGHALPVDQYFGIEWDQVYNYFDPLDTTGTQQQVEKATGSSFRGDKVLQQSSDPCSGLPNELLLHITDFLEAEDLVPFMLASRAVYQATRSNKFWGRRLRLDAPWFWEAKEDLSSFDHDLHQKYNGVMMQALRPTGIARRGHQVTGFANRRRIWHVAEEVLRLYETVSPLQKEVDTTPRSVFEEEAMCRYLPRVADQSDIGGGSETVFFFRQASDMHVEKNLKLFWAGAALCGISVTIGNNPTVCGEISAPETVQDSLAIAKEDWIKKLVVTISINESTYQDRYQITRLETDHFIGGVTCYLLSGQQHHFGEPRGSKRLYEPLPGQGIVGLRTEFAEGRFVRLGLLEHPNGLSMNRPANDSKVLDLLWKTELPPWSLRFSDFVSGYWTGGIGWDVVPMEAMMFGTTERELSTVTSFGATQDLRRLEIHRANGSRSCIGTGEGSLKTMHIDGPGGERVAGIKAVVGPLPVGIIIVTNRGRQGVFGKSRDNTLSEFGPEHGLGVAGIYCSFTYGLPPLLSSFGIAKSPDVEAQWVDLDGLRDTQGLHWDPRPPPDNWQTLGNVYGTEHSGSTAMVVDFSRPVKKIEGLLPAPEWLDIIELGGWTVYYNDDLVLEPLCIFGFTSRVWPAGPHATVEDLRQMKRHDSMAMSLGHSMSTSPVAHVGTDEEALAQPSSWDLGSGGEKIVAVTIWAADYLDGIQFHSESGKDSPRWGKCGGEPAARIEAGGTEQIVGLKILLGNWRYGHSTAWDVPLAVQAVSASTGNETV